MFEAHVLHLLRRYLGDYVHGLSAEALRISVWKGDVVLKDLKLKAEALNSLKLPVTVRAGFVGTVTLKVPWKSLGKEPVIVLIDRVFILAQPIPDGRTLKEEDREKLLETKLQQIEETEFATLEAISKSKLGNASNGNSWLGSLIATIIGNLKISISNVHVRYEDSISNPGHPFCSGVTLAKLAAVTMDEQGNETFDTSGALDNLRKSLQLERLAMYHDSNSLPWTIDKRWEDLNPKEWIEIFEDGINEPSADCPRLSKWAMNRNYLVSPINGNLKYHRLGNQERNNPELPFEKASVVLSNVAITITETQYHDWIKLLEVISRYKTYIEVSHLRPVVPVLEASYLWWRYAAQASLQQKKMCYRFSWDRIQQLCQLRRKYIQLYAGSLQRLPNINIAEIRKIENDLDSKVILLWRLLAHAKLESVKSKEAAERRKLKKGSWFPFLWGTNTNDMSDDSSEGSQIAEDLLTREEWQAVNKLLSFQPDELISHSGKDSHNMIQFLVTVTVGQAAARIVNVNETEIVCGRFEQLHLSTKFKHRSTQCDVLLKYYGLSAPEGSLAQSVCSEQKVNAVVASFVRSPFGENVDWRLSATISPCHVTILMESCDRFLEFVKRSNAVSPTVALETATALQMKFEKVTRRAQEQIQMVLEEQSRFALDIDFDAPKVRVPIKTCCSSQCDSHFLLDFGHFTLHTMESQLDEQRQNIYSRFYISGRDIAALFTDCGSECHNSDVVESDDNDTVISSAPKDEDSVFSLVDRCGIAVLVDRVKVPHPKYPSTRIFIQVPNLSIHFSPARYRRIMELLHILYGTMNSYGQPSVQNSHPDLAPWGPPECSIDARILVWRGIGNSVATWHPCFIVLSGLYLYLLEGSKSQSYQRYISMAGKQVNEVPPTNVGGSLLCIAVSSRGLDIYQALESSSTWVLQFRNEEEKAIWFKALVLATYQASAPLSADILSKKNSDSSEYVETENNNFKTANLVINGALMEARLFIYGKTRNQNDEKLSEMLILELLATGGKVHTIHCDSNLTIKMKLHSLKIKDELQGCLPKSSPYLACSVLQKGELFASSVTSDSLKKEMSSAVPEDEDTFTDAFPDFLSLAEAGICVQNKATTKLGIYADINDATGFESADTLFHENDFRRGRCNSAEIFYEAEGCDNSDFVSIMFLTRTPDSSDYDGIDTQLSIRMAKLEFYCNRPTLVALIDFGLELSSLNNIEDYSSSAATLEKKSDLNESKSEEKGRVRGLLGHGKVRVVFYLNMNVDSVSVFLNKEDGSQLAMFVQESFLLDLKVHPSSLSIEGMLGNFRLCDLSLGADHCWSWLCDIRNPGVDSLIKFKFDSFSSEDDDYEGYDYSLSGRLSAVRIVFLYRFVQEIMVYFMELATPHPEEAIKLVDKVGGFEWLIQKYEMDGATALKLDLSLDTPIIVLPQNSKSRDFIQLDLGQLHVKNEFSWHGCPEKDASAVHLDILCAKILGINMSVGINGCLGKPMIREGQGIEVFVRRSLRDVFRKVPTFSIEVKVGLLHGVMSDKEYKVILDCTYMNLNEEPRLPPSFRGSKAVRNDTMRLLVDKVNTSSQILLSRTVTIITVIVDNVLLELCNGIQEESPLALLSVEGLWVSYRMTSLSETDLYVTIPKFSVVDIRADTNAEMRLMLGSLADTCKQNYTGKFPFLNKDLHRRTKSESALDVDLPISTMFLMDYRWRRLSQSFVIRVQQPRVLVVPDFLLAVVEFFVPAFGTITGREETMDPRNDPICRNNNIVLTERIHKQSEDILQLSSCRQLVADSVGIDDYIYDGGGKVIYLSEETHVKGCHSLSFRPLIIIGRGKRLRFVNVRIENGSLLKKYVYLSNDSCFSVSPEDGVEVVLLETSSIDDEKRIDSIYEASDSSSSLYSESDLHMKQTFTFETQVVSPEFTFYDDTKSSLIESAQSEKLLRAKLDISFMYASKENDTWIRAIVKDFNIEAGSGLIILHPIDISGGYTSMKDKTNLSIVSTDISIHLSLSVISLILNLQNQAAGALQFGSAIPLVACTNFNRIWVSPKESGFYPNLSFWRPRPPPNYVVLGDCVTSRPVPPSQAVMAVSNTYGRVRRPISFDLIGMFPGIQGFGANEEKLDVDDCFLWQPVAPSGYVAVGCVAHIGNQPPPNNIVYCIRSDLLTSTVYSDCIFSAPSNKLYASGFSIWRLENIFGSFTAHASTDFPARSNACDLNCLLWNSNQHYSSFKESAPNSTTRKASSSQHKSDPNANSSGWDILRSISKGSNCYIATPNFERIWWDKGNDLRRPVSIWRPIARPGYVILGDCITEGLEPPALGILFKDDNPDVSAKPVQFTKVAHIVGRGYEEAIFWYPIAPPGYASLGCVVTKTGEVPRVSSFCCPRIDIVSQASVVEVPMSRSSNARASQSWSIWKVDNQARTFLARADLKKPSNKLAYTFADSVKPKTRENLTAELKFRCFSVTVLDNLCGRMTPIFNASVTDVKLATQGQLEAMNAVLVSSIAASTFNTQLEEWEPLVEPFDGIFKFETYDTNKHPPSKLGKRFRIAATSILNVNLSAANIDNLVGSIISWRRQLELDHKANKLNEGSVSARKGESTFSALDLDDLQTVIIENKLGCDIYLKKLEQNSVSVDCLHHGDCASMWIPPPVFAYSLNVADDLREARFYVAIQIIQAKGLPIINDGNSHNFFCVLRLVIESEVTDQQKLFPQSARTKCVNPSISKINDQNEGTAEWNELFIFELSRKAPSKLEVEVTNLAAKAGKGEVVGAFSFSVGPASNDLKKVASLRKLNQMYNARNVVSYPLRKTVQQNNLDDILDHGSVMVSTSYFERKPVANVQRNVDSDVPSDRDIGFWMGLGPDGEWHSIRSLLPLTVVPKTLEKDHIVMETLMKNGKKHAIFRGLATLINESDVKLNISICHVSFIRGLNSSTEQAKIGTVVEEVFENQYYRPTVGWTNNDDDAIGHWSTRDFSNMSKDFFEPYLPAGWQWTSTWSVEKSQLVDHDGWAYGPHLHSLMWPLTSSMSCRKSNSDNVRRRRWTCTRQQLSVLDVKTQSDLSSISPGCSFVLPWRCTSKDSDECLLVRPFVDHSTPSFTWGRSVATGSVYACEKDLSFIDQGSLGRQGVSKLADNGQSLAFKLNQLEKKDILLCCYSGSKQFWLSMGADASVLHTELNSPVYDWKISVNSPMKLENRLPCPAEFTIWEKTKEGNCIQRQQGLISSRQSVHIYSADIQKHIYLTLFVQGGWRLEKDAVLVLDPLLSYHVSSFWMVHQKNKRRLRVSIERDMGGTSAAPKTIRFFVPYWIMNDSSLSLTYRVVEVGPCENESSESFILQRTKSAKTTSRNPSGSMDRRFSSIQRRNVHVYEVIEDTSPVPSMLSPQDSVSRSGVTPFTSQKDAYRRVGITVAIQHSEMYSPGISLQELENKERVDVKAFNSDGSYYKLSALLNMTSDRTKVIHFQPHTLFINRVGYSLCLQQCQSQSLTWLHATDPPKHFEWQSSAVELLKLRVEGYEWSTPFSVCGEGAMEICLNKDTGTGTLQLRVNVRSGAKSSRNEVIFRPRSTSSPYRIENRTMIFPIRFRQVDDTSDSWKFLPPNAAVSFLWEDLGRRHMLEILVDGTDPLKSDKYNIDEISEHQPIAIDGGPTKPLLVSVVKEEKMNIVKISDWIPENEPTRFPSVRSLQTLSQLSRDVDQAQELPTSSDCEFHLVLELPELGLSLIDHTPEEILYLSVQNLFLAHSTGLGSGISRFELKMRGIQVDNQLPLSPMPVLFRPQRSGDETDYVLKFSITNQSNGSLDLCVYPYIGFQGPENSAFLINIHEPIIWRLHEMIQQVNLSRLRESQSTSVSVDPIIQIGVLNISEVRFKVSMAMSPGQRPRGVLGFWSSLMTALGNTENMPVRINQKFRENICMRQSSMISIAVSNIRKDILSQPLQLLSGVDILGNASSALGHMSKGVAALSMDKKFIQGRQRQENKGVEDFGGIIREGGGALAKGLFRGVTGILTKPLEGAKSSGVEGFVQGVGKGIIGAAAQPVSGVLDLLSKTTEGANAMRMKITSAITSDEQLLRRRLPRVIGGDNLIRPYDEFKARGQVILQLAESGSFFLQVDLFKVRGKFALSDAYEDHFLLPKGRIVMITHRRVLLLQQPSAIIAQRKFSPAKDPCSVLWDVSWGDLMTMELTHGKKDQPKAPPSQLILYLQTRSAELKDQMRIIKCSRETHQALEVYSSIEQAMNIYGHNVSKEVYKRKVRKPYSPNMDGGDGGFLPRESSSVWSPQHVPASVPPSSTFGSGSDA